MGPIGLYVHVPFCASKCGYCDFYSETTREGKDAYLQVLEEEIRSYAGQGITADSLFVGGGTPSMLAAGELGDILDACREVFGLAGECTLEANPDSVSPEFLREVRQRGFNRISFGAQSAVDSELRALGRRHDAARIGTAVEWARQAGFDNLSLDVMLGIPGQSRVSLGYTLGAFAELAPEHLSCYLLKIEEGTPFYRQHMERLCAGDDLAADLYLQTVETLSRAGYRQYEISNFAKPGRACVHNLKYWRCMEYLGFGPAAHSFFEGERFYHPRGLSAYLESRGANRVPDGPGGGGEEQILLGLRLAEGMELSALPLPEAERAQFLKKARVFEKAGLAEEINGRFRLTPEGFLVSNSVLAELLSFE